MVCAYAQDPVTPANLEPHNYQSGVQPTEQWEAAPAGGAAGRGSDTFTPPPPLGTLGTLGTPGSPANPVHAAHATGHATGHARGLQWFVDSNGMPLGTLL